MIVMLPMWRTAATMRNRSSCSAAVNPTVSSAFYRRHSARFTLRIIIYTFSNAHSSLSSIPSTSRLLLLRYS